MNFKLGFAAGLAAGWWLGRIPPDERRAKVDQLWSGVRENPRVQRVTETVVTDAHRLGDAVEQRFVDTTGTAVNAVAGTVEPSESSGSPSTGTSMGASSTGESTGKSSATDKRQSA